MGNVMPVWFSFLCRDVLFFSLSLGTCRNLSFIFWNSMMIYLRMALFASIWLPFNLKTCVFPALGNFHLWSLFSLEIQPVGSWTSWMLTSYVFSPFFSHFQFPSFWSIFWEIPFAFNLQPFYLNTYFSNHIFNLKELFLVLLSLFFFQSPLFSFYEYNMSPWLSQILPPNQKLKAYVSSISWVSSVF